MSLPLRIFEGGQNLKIFFCLFFLFLQKSKKKNQKKKICGIFVFRQILFLQKKYQKVVYFTLHTSLRLSHLSKTVQKLTLRLIPTPLFSTDRSFP